MLQHTRASNGLIHVPETHGQNLKIKYLPIYYKLTRNLHIPSCRSIGLSVSLHICISFLFPSVGKSGFPVRATSLCRLVGQCVFGLFTTSSYLSLCLPACLPACRSIYLAFYLPNFHVCLAFYLNLSLACRNIDTVYSSFEPRTWLFYSR